MQKLVQRRMKAHETMPKILGPVSVKISDVHTGAWRYRRPIVRAENCIICGVCIEYCPCGVVEKKDGRITIDYVYCKGCGICAAECPKKAIDFVLESEFEGREL